MAISYSKTTWTTGDIITAALMNNNEDGIYDVTDFVDDRCVYGDNERATTQWTTGVDNITKSGFYWAETDTTNLPVALNGHLKHQNNYNNNNYAIQYYTPYNSTNRYFRRKGGGSWGSWKRLYLEGDSPEFADITATGDLEVASTGKIGIGALDTNGTWIMVRDGDALDWHRRESGVDTQKMSLTDTGILYVQYFVVDDVTMTGQLQFTADYEDKISLYGDKLGDSDMYGFGVEADTLYFRSNSKFRWYRATTADGGTSDLMELNSTDLFVDAAVTATGNISLVGGSTNNFVSRDGSSGITGTFGNADGDTVTYKNGIITSVA